MSFAFWENLELNTFINNCISIVNSNATTRGNICAMTMGLFHVSTEIMALICFHMENLISPAQLTLVLLFAK